MTPGPPFASQNWSGYTLGTVAVGPQKTSYLTFLRRGLTLTISLRSNHEIIPNRCSVGALFAAQTGPGSYFGMPKADRGPVLVAKNGPMGPISPGPLFT